MKNYDKALEVVIRDQNGSASYLVRTLGLTFPQVVRIHDRMEKEGIVSPANHLGKRNVLTSVNKKDYKL